jgi:hypothetical protein
MVGRFQCQTKQTNCFLQVEGPQMIRFLFLFFPLALLTGPSVQMGMAQDPGFPPAHTLPGNGLAQHPFLYCGEWQNRSLDQQTMYLVEAGRVIWSFTNQKTGELGDCTRLSNGNIVFSRQRGASEVTPSRQIVWDYEAPEGTEIHTAYPLGNDRVMVMQNGNPARLLVLRKSDNRVLQEVVLPTRTPSTHGQFRHVRPTAAGTFLVAHMDLGKVSEYTAEGKEIWSVDAPDAWAAVRLKNGNTLISGNGRGYVREVDATGRTVWEITRKDLPEYPLYTVQEVSRLANGNTLINNWAASQPIEKAAAAMQLIEVTPAKKVVWAISDWKTLGPASSTQLLDEPGVPEKGELQR